MNETLENLEQRRKSMYKKLEKIGDFRRGTISENYRKCGKKNCICTQKGHPGHGPRYLWNVTIKGESYAKNLKLGPEAQKYLQETDNYRNFVNLCDEIIQVNERICNLRPLPEIKDNIELENLKKNLQALFKRKFKKKLNI